MFERAQELLYTCLFHEQRLACADEALSPIRRGARIFAGILRELPIGYSGTSPFAGEFGLEFTCEAQRASWEERIAVAKQGKPYDWAYAKPYPPVAAELSSRFGWRFSHGGLGHSSVDYGFILAYGLKEYARQAAGDDDFDLAVREALVAMKDFAARYHCRVPWEPATDLREALQSILFMLVGQVTSEHVSWSYSLGRFDQYLLPYWQKTARDEADELLAAFFRRLNDMSFIDDATALNLGGEEGLNELSWRILDLAAKLQLPSPLLTVRVSERLSHEDFARLCRPELLRCGQPTFYGEEACRKALLTRGVPESELADWVVNSCMGLKISAREWQDMWGAVVMTPLALEMALNNGEPLRGKLPLACEVPPKTTYASFAELFEQVCRYLAFFVRESVLAFEKNRQVRMEKLQNPFMSALYADCLSRKRDVLAGGVRYLTMIVETFGMINLADSLFSVKKLVFEQKASNLSDLLAALQSNFSDAPELLAKITALPKYGQNHPEVDALVKTLTERIAAICAAYNRPGFFCVPSLHTLAGHIEGGTRLGATLDGRRDGEPLAKNAGTRPAVVTPHTSLLLSASAWDQGLFSGGQALDLWIAPTTWESPENIAKFETLCRSYFRRGGLQLQVNGASVAELQAAMAEPDKYQQLTVRIGGFSVRFVTLSKQAQRDFISRFAAGM
ncbi:MAG: glycyl radical enzyme domain-containing protein [Lentisphaeria bacterium]|jgi:pyruvate-formate lyase